MAREKFSGKSDSDSKKGRSKSGGTDRKKRSSSSDKKASEKSFSPKTDKPFSIFRKENGAAKKDGFKKNDKYKSSGKEDRGFKKSETRDGDSHKGESSFKKGADGKYYSVNKSTRSDKDFDKKSDYSDRKKSYDKKDDSKEKSRYSDKPRERRGDDKYDKRGKDSFQSKERPYDNKKQSEGGEKKYSNDKPGVKRYNKDDFKEGKTFKSYDKEKRDFKSKKPSSKQRDDAFPKQGSLDGLVRLNKYLANAGISSRRDADTLILSGTVKVNGVVVDQLGTKIKSTDVVTYADATIKNERKIYLLLNKPKDFITTTEDPQDRRTVMELIKPACKERIYPVGRLDRNTTGLLLFSNDGDLATKLMHPKYEVRKVYHVSLNKALNAEDFKKIAEGFDLEDGPVKVDDIAYVGEGKKEIGIEIHSGRNRIVRRIFESLGYDVLKLDRVVYAGLTKKDLPRGKYRFLSEKEVAFLKMLR